MNRKKLLNKLAGFLDTKGRKQRKHRDELSALMVKLKKKEVDLENILLLEKQVHKRKRLNKELNIVRAQYAKGNKTLQELETL